MTNNLSSIIEGLDSSQSEAVRYINGPELIVAGAGSGKTRVLTSRIAYIIETGCDPSRILALTFTKKAAGEMKERIAAMVGRKNAWKIAMGTFHSVFIRFLREYSDFLGYPPTFTIYDAGDSQSAIRRILKDMKLDEKVYKPKDVLGRISMAKNNLITPEAYFNSPNAIENDRRAKKPEICRIYAAYRNFLKQAGVMDFDDILLNMNILLRDNPEALEDISSRFDYILVDEYQDTNYSQYIILKRLGQKHRNICVVGDDSQSIYAFRGAKIENILNFKKDYPDCKIFRLEQNYRSTRRIVGAANSLISNNEGRIPKTCFSEGEEGEKIRLIKAYSEEEEAILIASSIISTMQEDHSQYQDFAILYRTNAQSRAIEDALRRRNLPYMIYSGNSFFDRQEVKDMMAYFKLVVNLGDDEAFRRAVNKPARGIGDTSLAALSEAARAKGLPLALTAAEDDLEKFGLRPAAITRIRNFAGMINSANAKSADTDAYVLAAELIDASGLYRFYKEEKSVEGESRAANIEELANSVKSFVEMAQNEMREEIMTESDIDDPEQIKTEDLDAVTLGDYLENISLLSSVDVDEDKDSRNRVALMTVHSAKGLEFPHVFVAGMEENLFPSGGMYATPADIEEERRLFYVALTRAEKSVSLSFARTRMRNGKHESNPPSRFIKEIDKKYIGNPLNEDEFDVEEESTFHFGSGFGRGSAPGRKFGMGGGEVRIFKRERSAAPKPSVQPNIVRRPAATLRPADADFVPVSILELKEGQTIEHNRFGIGRIRRITGSSADLKAVIDFDSYGEKILLLKYAKIRFPK